MTFINFKFQDIARDWRASNGDGNNQSDRNVGRTEKDCRTRELTKTQIAETVPHTDGRHEQETWCQVQNDWKIDRWAA